jgi:heptosyltransferase-1
VNVALVRLSALGDVVHALPVAAALRAALPQARLVWLAERRETALLADNPAVDEVLTVDTRTWRRARSPRAVTAALGALAGLRERLAAARFDVAIDLQGLVKSGVLVRATRAPLRIGFVARACREPLAALFTNHRVTPPARAGHVIEQNLALLAPLGVAAGAVAFPLPASAAAERRAEEFLAEVGLKPRDRLVILNPGAGRADKRWPLEHFRTLARRLVGEAGAAVLVVWGPAEAERARAIVDAARPGRSVLAPPTDLLEALALLRLGSVVVAADTGPLHLAAAVGTPCVGLYGPTSLARNGPWGQAEHALASPDGRMASLAPELVLARVLARLEGGPR